MGLFFFVLIFHPSDQKAHPSDQKGHPSIGRNFFNYSIVCLSRI